MSSYPDTQHHRPAHGDPENPLLAEVVPTDVEEVEPRQIPLMPILLFLFTCYSTYTVEDGGLAYAVAIMGILLCHEFGHYLQARRYGVPASLPYFIPMPISPIGTMGAVIAMRGHMGDRKALFDIGITGPLAGLVPALICTVVGLRMSSIVEVVPDGDYLGAPLLFLWLSDLLLDPLGPGQAIDLHPIAFAGWVGVFITALNLIPIGQLDGGHVLYALLRKKAHPVATVLLVGAMLGVVLTGNYGWLLMIALLWLMGPNHPPTANDDIPLGTGRTILGWLTLCFMFIGFTPTPFMSM